MNLNTYLNKHKEWSEKTFGKGTNTEGLCKHITKELDEIKESPKDATEYADVFILLIDMLWRNGLTAEEFEKALEEKQEINLKRKWHVENMQTGKPIEHVRE